VRHIGTLTRAPAGTTLHAHMSEDDGPSSRLLQLAIWLATLFFAAMLFVPLIRAVLRRAAEVPPGF